VGAAGHHNDRTPMYGYAATREAAMAAFAGRLIRYFDVPAGQIPSDWYLRVHRQLNPNRAHAHAKSDGVEQGGGNSCRLMYAAAFKAEGAAVKPNLRGKNRARASFGALFKRWHRAEIGDNCI
jgi:hypothetical protein